MRRHEIELITALAEGTLDDETEARALVASSDALRAEYEAQRAAIEASRQLPGATMSDPERATLRRDVWAALRSNPTARPSARRWSPRLAAAAAALLVVAGTAAVLGQMTPSETGEAAAIEPAASPLSGERDLGDSPGQDAALATDDGEEGTAAPAAGLVGDVTVELEQVATRIRAEQQVPAYQGYEADSAATDDHSMCLETLGLVDQRVLGEYLAGDGTLYVVLVSGDPVGPDTPISFIEPLACEMVFTD